MKISLRELCTCGAFFISFILNNNLEGSGKYRDLLDHYPQKKYSSTYTPKKNKGKTENARIYRKCWQFVKILCICPMEYEFEAVATKLKHYTCNENQKNAFHLNELRKYVSLKANEAEFFNIKGKLMFLVKGGKRQDSVSFKLGEITSTLKHLDLVIIGGICGCSDLDIPFGSIMLPMHFYSLSSLALYNYSKDGTIPLQRKDKNILSTSENICLHDDTPSFSINDNQQKIHNKIIKDLNAHNCINFTSDFFIDNAEFCTKLINNFKDKEEIFSPSLPHIFNMEDYAVIRECLKKDIPFFCVRIVSDHAGQDEIIQVSSKNPGDSSNPISENKKMASEILGKTLCNILTNTKTLKDLTLDD